MHPALASAGAGVLAHAVVHQRAPRSLGGFAALLFLAPLAVSLAARPASLLLFLAAFARALPAYWTALSASVVAYRLSPFHPLARYPGPLLARVSRFWATRVMLSGVQHKVSHDLFERYGDVVRTGPDHLIFRDPAAIPVVLGGRNMWRKGDRYEVAKPEGTTGSLLSQMEPAGHAERRKIWDRAFTPNALKSYEPLLAARVAELLEKLSARLGTEVDIAEWVSLLALDFMGDFAYGGAFNTMRAGGDTNRVRKNTEKGVNVMEALGTVSWVRPLVLALPQNSARAMMQASLRVAEARRAQGASARDLFYYLLDEDGEGGHPPMTTPTLALESTLAIVAGSDTTSTALSNALFHLLTTPAALAALRAELDAAAGNAAYDVPWEAAQLADLPYLNAIILETTRLWPAVPNGVQRTPPSDGGPVVVAGHVVPVGTTVQIPTWSLHRDARHFAPDPQAFWPERWTAAGPKLAEARGAEFRLNKAAWMPFNYGPGNCIGRALAMGEMRAVLAALVRRFDIRLAPAFDRAAWERELEDRFVLARGALPVVMSKRA